MSALTKPKGKILNPVTKRIGEPSSERRSVMVTICHPEEPSPTQQLKIIEASGSLEFWEHPDEDVYNAGDGNDV